LPINPVSDPGGVQEDRTRPLTRKAKRKRPVRRPAQPDFRS
jgi:hypothetical protein